MSPVLSVSTHIYVVSREIHRKTFHFSSKPRHVTPQIDHHQKVVYAPYTATIKIFYRQLIYRILFKLFIFIHGFILLYTYYIHWILGSIKSLHILSLKSSFKEFLVSSE